MSATTEDMMRVLFSLSTYDVLMDDGSCYYAIVAMDAAQAMRIAEAHARALGSTQRAMSAVQPRLG